METAAYVVLSFAVLCPWLAIVAVALHFRRSQERLLKSNDDLTSQIIAFKNPGAAVLFAQQQHAQMQQVHREPERIEVEDDEFLG